MPLKNIARNIIALQFELLRTKQPQVAIITKMQMTTKMTMTMMMIMVMMTRTTTTVMMMTL